MIKQVFDLGYKWFAMVVAGFLLTGIGYFPAAAQSTEKSSPSDRFESLRSDVGIHGLTVNLHQFSDFTFKGDSDSLNYDSSSELEFVYRNVRMMTPRLGVGYQVLTSFFTGGDDSGFGVGSWGVGPIIRAYPFKTDQVQPYVQLNSLFGNNLGLSKLANTTEKARGFRVRMGIRTGVAVRITNTFGLFTEIGYDWESSRIFKSDSRALQANIGFDFYLFN